MTKRLRLLLFYSLLAYNKAFFGFRINHKRTEGGWPALLALANPTDRNVYWEAPLKPKTFPFWVPARKSNFAHTEIDGLIEVNSRRAAQTIMNATLDYEKCISVDDCFSTWRESRGSPRARATPRLQPKVSFSVIDLVIRDALQT